jgi:hypothetical protein
MIHASRERVFWSSGATAPWSSRNMAYGWSAENAYPSYGIATT